MATFKVKGYYKRGGQRYVGVEENGIIYGFPADTDLALLEFVQGARGDASLGELGFLPQSEEEKKQNQWEE